MSTITETRALEANEAAAHSICTHSGYYVRVIPRLVGEQFWVGPFFNHQSANYTRRKNYPWPRYDTEEAWYFEDGTCLS